jgi:hypothetical protein
MFTIAPTHTAARTTVARPTTARKSSRKASALVVARASKASTDGVTSIDRRAVMRGVAFAVASGLVAAPREVRREACYSCRARVAFVALRRYTRERG